MHQTNILENLTVLSGHFITSSHQKIASNTSTDFPRIHVPHYTLYYFSVTASVINVFKQTLPTNTLYIPIINKHIFRKHPQTIQFILPVTTLPPNYPTTPMASPGNTLTVPLVSENQENFLHRTLLLNTLVVSAVLHVPQRSLVRSHCHSAGTPTQIQIHTMFPMSSPSTCAQFLPSPL